MQDYLAGREPAARLFSGLPDEVASYTAQWAAVRPRFDRAARESVAAAVRPTSAGAAERLRQFVEEGGAVVTTGQQAGLFTGPLYTIYKILTAIRLAEVLEAELGILVLPLFWVASEDHDWLEINHADLGDPTRGVRRVELASAESRPVPIRERRLEADVINALDELTQIVAKNGYSGRIMQQIRAAYRPGTSVSAAFHTLIESLFSGFDLLVTDAADPVLKRRSMPVLEGAIDAAPRHERLLEAQVARIRRAGYHEQVAVIPGAANLFLRTEAGRERLRYWGERWRTAESREVYTAAELRMMLAADPARFSPNVLLRPVVESCVFPTLAYVAGPGEINYFAQLPPLFAAYGLRMPVVVPRASMLLVTEENARLLEQLDFTADELRAPRHELAARLARRAMPAGVVDSLAALRSTVADGYQRLIEAAMAVDPTLSGPLGANRNDSLAELDRSERKVRQHVARGMQPTFARLDQVRAQLVPADAPQERVLNVLPFLLRDPDLLQRLFAAVETSLGRQTSPPALTSRVV